MYAYAGPFDGKDYGIPPMDSVPCTRICLPPNAPDHSSRMQAQALAMMECSTALSKLDPESRKRVIEWLVRGLDEEWVMP